MQTQTFITLLLVVFLTFANTAVAATGKDLQSVKPSGYPSAVFAGGCFWCIESEFRRLDGVLFTQVGYTGGTLDNPKYEDTHDGASGHAEAVEVTYDPKKISYRALVEFFLTQAHDPTELNRQGPDVGTQYRSAIFYDGAKQKKIAQDIIANLTQTKHFKNPIVTQLVPAQHFWEAEEYHQQYFEKYKAKTGQEHPNLLSHEGRKNAMDTR